jgi:Flp pilus assembly protein TadD
MAVPPALQARLREKVLAGQSSPSRRLERLADFMFDAEHGLGMSYQEDATYTVERAYDTREANCLAFTLLFLALAREAGLDAYPQEIRQTLSWHQRGDIVYRSGHINALVRIGGRGYTVDVAGDSVIARDQPVPVSDARLLSHYYNNLAVELLARGQPAPAAQYVATALQLDPSHAPHWSNAGVILLRNGDAAAAEDAYDRALALDPAEPGALFNMAGLAHRQGDGRREAEYRRRLAAVQQKDPFHQVLQAIQYERAGDYSQAIKHYRRAIRLHPDEHRFYSALARAYLGAGDTRRAAKALARAQHLSDGEQRAAYRAQLDDLRRASN